MAKCPVAPSSRKISYKHSTPEEERGEIWSRTQKELYMLERGPSENIYGLRVTAQLESGRGLYHLSVPLLVTLTESTTRSQREQV